MKHLGLTAGWPGKTFIVQGFGKVGSYAANYMHDVGAKMIGVAELDGHLYSKEGINPKV